MSALMTESEIQIMLASESLASSAVKNLTKLAEETLTDTVNDRVDQILNDILFRFRNVSGDRTCGNKVPDMSAALYDHIKSLRSWNPDEFKLEEPWECPAFNDLYCYWTTLCYENRSLIPFGTLSEECLTLDANGQVVVDDWDKDSFQGQGTMIISHECVGQIVEVFVLGHIEHTGTAVLVDKQQKVWFYNPPCAVDEYLCGFSGSAMLVMKKGELMTENCPIVILERYDGVTVQLEEDESDDECL
jgi:hypothetical protein